MKASLVLVALILSILAPFGNAWSATKTAQYANIDYDVVYVRCPRGKETVVRPDGQGDIENWNGVNDIWLSASNNIYMLPGCDLVLHHSDPNYDNNTGTALPAGHPDREEVLVNCDETNTASPVCSVVDPNVSLDGGTIIYAKFTDTRTLLTRDQWTFFENGGAGRGRNTHSQSGMRIDHERVSGDKESGRFVTEIGMSMLTYDAPVLIYKYDLATKQETRISPEEAFFAGRAYPNEDIEKAGVYPVMDTGPFFLPDGRIGFTSNRADGFLKFQLFTMDPDGKNLELIGHRALSQQLHPIILKDGRIVYTSFDSMLQREQNNQYSLFSINPDGSDPFIFAGENDATQFTYHFVGQLSDGDIVATIYYNHNNVGMGTLIRFPVDPPGADFDHKRVAGINIFDDFVPGEWYTGGSLLPFARVGQFELTEQATEQDVQAGFYESVSDYWIHPGRSAEGNVIVVNGTPYPTDQREVTVMGKFSHPSGAPDNDLLATYTIGGSSTLHHLAFSDNLADTITLIGKDAGIWLFPLEPNSQETIGHVADDGFIIVDQPEYHEIMARAVVPYTAIYGENPVDKSVTANVGNTDVRLPAGAPFALTGSASILERETAALNGTPWNMKDGGGAMSGRTYMNLMAQGGDLALYDDEEVWGIRVSMPVPPVPFGMNGGNELWAGRTQYHHVRILGEYPIRKWHENNDPVMNTVENKPDTSFIVRVPADTPFFFQAIDKRGMALNIETTSRSAARGEQQFCSGCHLHTREGENTHESVAKTDTNFLGDFTGVNQSGDYSGNAALLFDGEDANGRPTFKPANEIYDETEVPGVTARKSFAVDWENNIKQLVEQRCASCHAEGEIGHRQTGLRLKGDDKTYELLTLNRYTNDNGQSIDADTLPGDGLNDVGSEINGSNEIVADRITPHYSCCTPSRWISYNSARSSMLVWALYQERLDGRDPATGLPPEGSDVVVDTLEREHPEIWPNVTDHTDLNGMTEDEKRLIARWIDMGAPKLNTHDDLMRPVVTVTPGENNGGTVDRVYIGVWDDSPLDFSKLVIKQNGTVVTPSISGRPSVIEVPISPVVSASNADDIEFEVEVWDQPDRSLSLLRPGVSAANRTIKTFTGASLLRMAEVQVNSAPTSASATIETIQDTVSSGVVPTVVDPDEGDSHVITIATQPSNGAATVVNNRLVYTPNTGFTGNDSFQFIATDLSDEAVTGEASVTVQAAPDNNAPVFTSALIQTFENSKSGGVEPTVFDPDEGDTHTFSIHSQPSDGTASVEGNQLYYTPDADFIGDDSFEFTATDTGGASVTGRASVTVLRLNSPPTSASASIETFENRKSSGVVATVLDPDAGDTHTLAIHSQPSNGTASVEGNQLYYTPNADFIGDDSFEFTATDTGGASVTGTASVTVVQLNSPPTSASASIETFENRKSSGVVATVLDPDAGDTHTIAIQSQPSNGIASVENNRLYYTPNADFIGDDSFEFTATDSGNASVTGIASVTVFELQDPPGSGNSAPVSASAVIETFANRDSSGVEAAVLDPDEGDTHVIAIVTQPQNGVASVVDNLLYYSPNEDFVGNDSFEFSATDPDQALVIGTASVTVVEPPNSPPSSASAEITTFENQESDGVAPTVLDPDEGDTHEITIATQPQNGTATVENNLLYYTPDTDHLGDDSFEFVATDPDGESVTGIASVSVVEVPNSPPTSALAQIKAIKNRESVGVEPSVIDPDDGDTHEITIATQPQNGTATVKNNLLFYMPDKDFVGGDSFQFIATDSDGASVTGTASVKVAEKKSGGGGALGAWTLLILVFYFAFAITRVRRS